MRPFFCTCERAVDEALTQIELPELSQIAGDGLHHFEERAVFDPALEAAMAGLVRREVLRHLVPLRARVQNPQDAVEDSASILPWSSLPTAVR
jgi:hypothetical protein